ncbi:MAG TPA: D-2-hydroxyacid dehydrogenase [Candidatus Binatia bacterium]|nr:D-2-hydroxyacid dehydrogenase [Candidatus Binatia bacterium]
MTGPRLVFLDAATYGDVSLQGFTSRWDCTVHPVTAAADVARRLQDQSVVVTNKVKLDGALLNSVNARDLKLIAVAATGTDIIDKEAARKLGIKVCNVPGYATQSVAQFTFALILELATRATSYIDAVKAGQWQKSPVFSLLDYPSFELRGKKLGIIGYGNIGRAVAEMARGFGLEPLIAARPAAADPIPPGRISLAGVLREADILTLHCPLTPATQNLINERTLSWMKPGSFLINTARGALIDEAALIRALREKRLAGAALDVISQEPPPADHPVVEAARTLDNLLLTPHTAWGAREARERLLREVAENISGFFAGNPRNIVV